MITYGYGKNKGKREVYTKEETDENFISNSNNNEVTLTLEQAGTATIVRRGNVVMIKASMVLEANSSKTMANKASLPEWANPSSTLTEGNIKSTTGTTIDGEANGYIMVSITNQTVAFVGKNSNTSESKTIEVIFTYITD